MRRIQIQIFGAKFNYKFLALNSNSNIWRQIQINFLAPNSNSNFWLQIQIHVFGAKFKFKFLAPNSNSKFWRRIQITFLAPNSNNFFGAKFKFKFLVPHFQIFGAKLNGNGFTFDKQGAANTWSNAADLNQIPSDVIGREPWSIVPSVTVHDRKRAKLAHFFFIRPLLANRSMLRPFQPTKCVKF